MNFQYLAVIIIIAAAVVFAVVSIYRKRDSFSTKRGCGNDCGCGDASKKLTS